MPGPAHRVDAARARRLRRRLRSWYRRHGRDLPWRRTHDPWAVLVSEAMLQQTQASRVAERFPAFVSRFPTPMALAATPAADVVTAWSGLGYNRRAVALHRTAAVLVRDHGGLVPRSLDALWALPGVGDYTGRAVRAFAFDAPAAPVDTNVARVLARLVAGEGLSRSKAQALADALVPTHRPGEWGQALMELGATVCVAARPRCDSCPVAGDCVWRGQGPDPADVTAHRSRPQGRFAGSDRQARGRLVAALRTGPVAREQLAEVAGVDGERLERIVAALCRDGLAERHDQVLRLPG